MGAEPGRLEASGLTFAYPGATRRALDDVGLRIEPGEVVLLTGPSGCGKSTLALALCGLIPHRVPGRLAGRVDLDGRSLSGMPLSRISQRVGMVFQNPDEQLIHPTVEAEVAFGPENLALPSAEVRARVEEVLDLTGMGAHRRSLTASLSGGEKQRSTIAATLSMRPGVLVLDEPCSDLDPAGAQRVLSVLRRLNRVAGTTIVLIEHRVDEVVPWVGRVMLMDRGRLVLDRRVEDAFADPGPWRELGVAVPETVRLAHALPGPFAGRLPLSSAEAADALAGTVYAGRLAASASRIEAPAGAPAPPALAWRKVGLTLGGRKVLREVDLEVGRGEWVALAGPNGSGKTSLAGLAMGFASPTSGSIVVGDAAVVAGRVSEQAARLGYLFQSADTMLFSSTVASELTFAQRWGGRRIDAGWIAELLSVFDLAGREGADPFSLSVGQRQRLALATLLADTPRALILDEPTTGQDESHVNRFLRLLEQLRRELSLTYLMITHDMRAAARHAERLVVLAGGRILLQGRPSAVFARRSLLAEASIVPPPMADLHGRLAGEGARHVALGVEQLLAECAPDRAA